MQALGTISSLLVFIFIGPTTVWAQGQRQQQQRPVVVSTPPAPAPVQNLLQLQPFLSMSEPVRVRSGEVWRLVSWNHHVNVHFLLVRQQDARGQTNPHAVHLENPLPRTQILELRENGLVAHDTNGDVCLLENFPNTGNNRQQNPFTSLCNGKLFQRGNATALAANILNSLQSRVPFTTAPAITQASYAASANATQSPPAAAMEPNASCSVNAPLGIRLREGQVTSPAEWVETQSQPGIYVNTTCSRAVQRDLFTAEIQRRMDASDSEGPVTSIAFDLSQFELNYHPGFQDPRLGNCRMTLIRNEANQVTGSHTDCTTGPDGLMDSAPYVRAGLVAPYQLNYLAGTFTAGFLREHGKIGDRHYGFIENGVLFSRMQTGFATAINFIDGTFAMKTWEAGDNETLLPRIRSARQNGTPIIETQNGITAPATNLRPGGSNWSSDANGNFRSILRSGMCLLETPRGRFIVYSAFESATPSGMARVFQSYGCKYAMHLDMNGENFTQSAVYTVENNRVTNAQFLRRGMASPLNALPFAVQSFNRDSIQVIRRH